MAIRGKCLCEGVRFEISGPPGPLGYCHCGQCRRASGSAFGANADVAKSDFRFASGVELVREFESSPGVFRAFCSRCGTHLYYRLLATGEYFVPAGVFESNDFELASQIYIDKKPGYYAFANQTPMLTEQQVIAQFSAPGGETAD